MNWEPFETAPKTGRNILVFCPKNELGKSRILMAFYAERFTVETESDDGEYNEPDGGYYIPEGWYEFCWLGDGDDPVRPIEWPITHWMPLPKPPEPAKETP